MTLSELYHFKKNDTWSQVFEGQAKADAVREVLERQQKEVKNGTYGQQVHPLFYHPISCLYSIHYNITTNNGTSLPIYLPMLTAQASIG